MITVDRLVRSKRKTLSVGVNALGEVTVRAPMRTTEQEISAFLQRHEAWILKQKQRRKSAGVTLPPADLHGYTLLVLGEPYTVCVYDGERIALNTADKRLYLPRKNTEKRLIGWLKDNALRVCSQVVERKAREMDVRVASVSVTSARSFWGICTAQNALRFSYRLLYAPKAVVEYVVVHELSHVRHKNHSSAFWKEVEKYVPNWKVLRKWLKDRALLMQVF